MRDQRATVLGSKGSWQWWSNTGRIYVSLIWRWRVLHPSRHHWYYLFT